MHNVPSPEAWPQWLEEHAGRLLLFARQQCRLPADAEDMLQEALVEAWSRGRQPGPPPLALVYRTIRRRAIDRARSADRRSRREELAAAAEPDWFTVDFHDGETGRELQQVLARLPAGQREVLTMKIWGELTFQEIADALDIPLNTAASRYRYALETLRKLLAEPS